MQVNLLQWTPPPRHGWGGPPHRNAPCPMPFAIVLAHTPPLSASSFGQLFAPVTAREKCLVTGDGTGQLALPLVSHVSPIYET